MDAHRRIIATRKMETIVNTTYVNTQTGSQVVEKVGRQVQKPLLRLTFKRLHKTYCSEV